MDDVYFVSTHDTTCGIFRDFIVSANLNELTVSFKESVEIALSAFEQCASLDMQSRLCTSTQVSVCFNILFMAVLRV